MLKKFKKFYIIFLVFILSFHYIHVCNNTVATISVDTNPVYIAITPDNNFAYVANFYENTTTGTVSVINLKTNTVIKTISDPSFNQPYTVTLNAQGSKAYITNSNGSTITIIDTKTNTVTGLITGFDGPSGMVITPDGHTAYVNNYGGPSGVGSGNATTVRIVDLDTNTIVGPAITVGLAPASLAITPDGAFVYVINYVTGDPNTGTISVIDTKTSTVVQTIAGLFGPYTIAISSDGNYAYISNFGSNNFTPFGNTVSVLDLKTNKIIKNITLGIQPSGIALTRTNAMIYVTNYNSIYQSTSFSSTPGVGIVNIINAANNQVLCLEMVVGAAPSCIAISPDGKRAYTTNYKNNSVTVLDVNDTMWLS
jgi:YVTN family beta-propeller protein